MTASKFLILSGTYVAADLISEFGRVPPTFLPYGTQGLFQAQVRFARSIANSVFLSLPDDYSAHESDLAWLHSQNVEILLQPPELTLCQAVSKAIEAIGPVEDLYVLYGDTLVQIPDVQLPTDLICIGKTSHHAKWAHLQDSDDPSYVHLEERVDSGEGKGLVACGFFRFSDANDLAFYLAESGDFITAVNAYSEIRRPTLMDVDGWFDAGHLHAYYQSRHSVLQARSFNEIAVTSTGIRKTGVPARKIAAEINWYRSTPSSIRPYLPQIFNEIIGDTPSYELEYLHLPTLSELFVHARLPDFVWRNILLQCSNVLATLSLTRPSLSELPFNFPERFYRDILVEKSYARLAEFSKAWDIDPSRSWTVNGKASLSLNRLVEALLSAIRPTLESDICFWHGDFHFANIFYDSRSNRIRMIDPRGYLNDGTFSVFGDRRYDQAKLCHSVVGHYDSILADRFDVKRLSDYSIASHIEGPYNANSIVDIFIRSIDDPSTVRELFCMTGLLFISMLPLHKENPARQIAMLANSYRMLELAEAV